MPARRPEDWVRLFVEALNAGDLEALVALYERGGSLIPEPGQVVIGTEGIRQTLSAFIGMKPTLTALKHSPPWPATSCNVTRDSLSDPRASKSILDVRRRKVP